MGTVSRCAAALSLLVVLSACSKITLLRTEELRRVDDRVKGVGSKIDTLSRAVDDLSISQDGMTSKMKADLMVMLSDLQTQISRLHAEIDETQQHFDRLGARMDRLERRKVILSGETDSAAAESGGGTSKAPSDSGGGAGAAGERKVKVVEGLDLEHLYNQAREDYIRGKYELAFQGFRSVYEKDEGGSYKDNALYWMGECFLKTNQTAKALEMYERTVREFPRSNKVCAARFKAGLIHHQEKDFDRRDTVWKDLQRECPGTNEAQRAREIMEQSQ